MRDPAAWERVLDRAAVDSGNALLSELGTPINLLQQLHQAIHDGIDIGRGRERLVGPKDLVPAASLYPAATGPAARVGRNLFYRVLEARRPDEVQIDR